MSTIIVAGAGHGGLVAAMRLAQAGHSVTVLEKNPEDKVGHLQKDAFLSTELENAGIPVPAHYRAKKNRLTVLGSTDSNPVTLPAEDDGTSLWVDRRELCEFLIRYARIAGVKFIFNCEVTGAAVLGSRVVGVRTSGGIAYGDLIIDACGVDSPVRKSLPEKLCIQTVLEKYDKVFSYRAYFGKKADSEQPVSPYKLYLDKDGSEGFEWVVTGSDDVDVLILRTYYPSDDEIKAELENIFQRDAHIDPDCFISGERGVIPVRQPLAVFVADGYAAVGDSACMTMPVKGSGIGNALTAGVMLADAVAADTCGYYTLETLWRYEREYFQKIGYDSCRLALLKNAMPYVSLKDIDSLLQNGVLKTDELEMLSSAMLSSKGLSSLKGILKQLSDFPELKSLARDAARWLGRWTVIEPFFPEKYNIDDIRKWAVRYNSFFNDIKYNGGSAQQVP